MLYTLLCNIIHTHYHTLLYTIIHYYERLYIYVYIHNYTLKLRGNGRNQDLAGATKATSAMSYALYNNPMEHLEDQSDQEIRSSH